MVDVEIPGADTDVRCDFYFVPPTSDEVGDVSDTTTLPGTGIGFKPSDGVNAWLLGIGLLLLYASRKRCGRPVDR